MLVESVDECLGMEGGASCAMDVVGCVDISGKLRAGLPAEA